MMYLNLKYKIRWVLGTYGIINKFILNQRVVLMFGELNGSQLFSLTRSDFEKFCGKEEGTRLDSQIKLQKSLCGVCTRN